MYKLIFVYILLTCLSVSGGTIDPNNDDQNYISYGDKHTCVLPISGVYNDKLNSNFRGSCVLISPVYAITAAHVVANSINQYIIYKNESFPCLVVAIHGHYKPHIKGFHDIALIKLQRPINLDFYPDLYSDSNEVDQVCSIAGYGITGNFKSGALKNSFDNKKRAGSNVVASIEKNTLICRNNDNPVTTLEFLISQGDSGGGLFIDQKLAGINSCVYATDGNANSDYGDISAHTRISVYIDWIKNTKELIETTLK